MGVPTYPFECSTCQHSEDRHFASFAAAPKVGDPHRCPKCNAHTLRRLIARPAGTRVTFRPYESFTLPFNKDGTPQRFETQQQEREFMAGAFNGVKYTHK